MISKTILLPICIVLAGFSRYTFAAYGDKCSTTTACTAADNTNCLQTTGCAISTCSECKTGYILTGGSCKADIGTACTANADCAADGANGECDTAGTGKCICSSTYTHSYGKCVTTTKIFGASCTDATTCEVVAGSNGECIDSKCDCAAGYVKGVAHQCRQPYYDETCTNAVGCVVGFGMPDEQAPVCPAGTTKCVCDSATDESVTYGGVTFCNTKVATADKIEDTLTCTAHNACKSGRCIECPDTSGLICVGDSQNSATITMTPAWIVMLTFISGMLQL